VASVQQAQDGLDIVQVSSCNHETGLSFQLASEFDDCVGRSTFHLVYLMNAEFSFLHLYILHNLDDGQSPKE
jgi:hypothetical protein